MAVKMVVNFRPMVEGKREAGKFGGYVKSNGPPHWQPNMLVGGSKKQPIPLPRSGQELIEVSLTGEERGLPGERFSYESHSGWRDQKMAKQARDTFSS